MDKHFGWKSFKVGVHWPLWRDKKPNDHAK